MSRERPADAVFTCAGMSSFVFTAIIDSFRPSVFEAHATSDNLFQRRLAMLYSIIIYLCLAQSAVMTALAGFIIQVLYGNAYYPPVSALQIIVWYTTFSYLGAVRNIWVLANNKQNYLWIINLIGASANVILNVVFIPIIGINGAALASLITQFFTNVIVGYIIKPITPNNEIMLKGLNIRYVFDAIKILRCRNSK